MNKARQSLEAGIILMDKSYFSIAASRFYYSMFYVAEALLREEGLKFSKHSAVHAAFGKHFAKTARIDPKFHRALISAFRLRTLADYSLEEDINEDAAKDMRNLAEEFIQAAQDMIG